jgi:hypothetical protein
MQMSRSKALVTAAGTAICTPFVLTGCVVPSPSPGTLPSLMAVAAVNATNAWAVGAFDNGTGSRDLMEHWNGRNWQVVALPPPVGSGLHAITAVSASNIWAVGPFRTLHFNGLSWRSVPNPNGVLMTDAASAPDGAVYGMGVNATGNKLLAMTAGGWRPVSAIPGPTTHRTCDGGGLELNDLSVGSGTDIWVVGSTTGASPNDSHSCALALHWNGATWQSFATPAVVGAPQLLGVSARAANDVWAVGVRTNVVSSTGRDLLSSLVLHWNGNKWAAVPNVDERGGGFLDDIDATAEGVWAVGMAPQLSGFPPEMLIKKWNGAAMLDQPVQTLPVSGPDLFDAPTLRGVSVRAGVVVSVGYYSPTVNDTATLTDRRNAN